MPHSSLAYLGKDTNQLLGMGAIISPLIGRQTAPGRKQLEVLNINTRSKRCLTHHLNLTRARQNKWNDKGEEENAVGRMTNERSDPCESEKEMNDRKEGKYGIQNYGDFYESENIEKRKKINQQ